MTAVSLCLLSLEMLYEGQSSQNLDYRKLSSEMGVRITPMDLQKCNDLMIDDYRKKATKKAEPDAKAMALR
jgi:hypothetical protein